MLQISDGDATIHICTFQAFFERAKVNLRFPSLFFVEWKTINSKHSVSMIGRKRAINSVIDLDQTLTFTTEMIYHRGQRQYLKKESLIHLNLISNSRPDQIKLVGRVVIDLAEIANKSAYASITTSKLMYCSVEAEVSFKAKFVKNVESNMELNQLEKSAFSDLYSFTSPKISKSKVDLKEILGEKKYQDEKKRIKARLTDRQENGQNQRTNNIQNIKQDIILIKQQVSDQAVQNSVPKSLPLTEKKQDISPYQIQQQRYTNREYVQDAHQIDQMVHNQRNLLEKQLNQHKNRIQKLENDIRAAMKKFSESEEKSELHKSRLVETQNALHQLISKQNKLKAEYQQKISQLNSIHQLQIEKLKQTNAKEAEIMKSSYQADIKILKSKFQEERLKTQEIQANFKILSKNYQQTLLKIKQPKISQNINNAINAEIQSLQTQNQNLRKWLTLKSQQQTNLSAQLQQSKAQLQRIKNDLKKSQDELSSIKLEKNKIQESGSSNTQLQFLESQLKKERQNNINLQKILSQTTQSYQSNIKTLKQQIQTLRLGQPTKHPNIVSVEQFILRRPDIKENFTVAPQLNQNPALNIEKIKEIEQVRDVPIIEDQIVVQPVQLIIPQGTKIKQQDGSKFIQMQEELLAHKMRIQELESSIQYAKQNYQNQIQKALKELAVYQAQNAKLAETVEKTLIVGANSLDKQGINAQKLKQQLKVQDASITKELQTLKARSIPPQLDNQLNKLKSQNQRITNENYVLQESVKLLEMEAIGLKQERDNLKLENEKLSLDYQNLKNSRNKIQDQVSQSGLQSQQLILIKQQLQNEKENKRIEAELTKKIREQLEANKAQVSRLLEQNQRIRESTLEKQPIQVISTEQKVNEHEENPAKVHILESLHIDLTSRGFGESPIKISSENEVIHVEQLSPNNVDTVNTLTLNTNLLIQQKLNNSAENAEERHNFNFQEHGVPLTHEEINNFSSNRFIKQEQINALREENQRLKDQIQQLKSQKRLREPISQANLEKAQTQQNITPIIQNKVSEQNNSEKKVQQTLQKQILKQQEQPQLAVVQNQTNALQIPAANQEPLYIQEQTNNGIIETPPVISIEAQPIKSLPQSPQQTKLSTEIVQKVENPSNPNQQLKQQTIFSQKQDQYKHLISEYQQTTSQLNAKIQELQGLISKNSQNKGSQNEKQSRYISEIQEKLYNLEQQIKIKDELLNQSERNFQQSYAIKYELADLKQQCNQLKSALDERDVYINELQETKEFLSKEVQKIEKLKSQQFQFQLQKIECQPEYQSASILQVEAVELKAQIETLHGQLVNLNNQNAELKAKIQDIANLKLQIERQKEQIKNKYQQNEKIASQISALKQKQVEYERQLIQINELKAKQAQFQLSNGHNAELSARIKEYQIVISKNKQQIEVLTSKLTESQKKEIQSQQKMNSLSQIIEKHQSDHSQDDKINELSQRLYLLQQQLLNLQNQMTLKDDLLKNSNQVIEDLKSSQSKLKDMNFNIQNQNSQLEAKLLTMSEEIKKASVNEGQTSQIIANLHQQLQKSKNKIQELVLQVQNTKLEKDKEPLSPMQRSNSSLPHLQVHTMSSYTSEASPIIYQRSTIRLAEGENVSSAEDQLKKNIESLKKEIENLQAQLAQQSQQKFFYFNQAQNSKTQALSLQQQVKQLKNQNQRLTLLPLQSFDTTHLLARKKQNEVITVDAKEGQPSIMKETPVNRQASISRPLPSAQSQSFKKEDMGQTEAQTKISSQQVQFIKKQMQILKEQLQSQRKLHYQLQQIHKICLKKYELLSSRYQNCIDQIQYYQNENEQLIKYKQKVDDQLYQLKAVVAQYQNAVNSDKKQQNLKDSEPFQSAEQIVQPEKLIDSNTVTPQLKNNNFNQHDYQVQIRELQKLVNVYKNKTAILQENIQNLQKLLQEQIQINQTNEKLSLKLEALNQLESIAQQFKTEMSQIKRENEQLKREKTGVNTSNIPDPQLTKLVEQHQLWSQERSEWQKKLQQIEQNLFNNESKYASEKHQLQQKIIELQGQKQALSAQKSIMNEFPIKTEEIPPNGENIATEKNIIAREQELLKQIQQIRGEKLQQLQRVVQLQQKINKIDSSKTCKQNELEQLLTAKNHEIEELKFISETSVRELQEQKFLVSELQLNYHNKLIEAQQLQKKYEESISQQNLNQGLEVYKQKINNYEQEIIKLGEQIKILEEEKLQSSGFEHLASDVDKLQIEIATKIAIIQQISARNAELQEKLLFLTHQIEQNHTLIQKKQDEKKILEEIYNKTKLDLDQLSSKKLELQKQLKISKQKHEEHAKNMNSSENNKEILLQKIKREVQAKQKEISQLQQRLKEKESEILKQTRQHEKLKLTNIKNQQKINNLTEKQKQMKQTMVIVQLESKKIVEALKARFQSQEAYYKKYVEKQRQCNRLTFAAAEFQQNIANKQRQLFIQQEKAEQLRNQLQLIKTEAGAQSSPKPTTIEYQKYQKLLISNEQLMNKNRQYLQVLGNKSTVNIQNQRLKNQVKTLTATSSQATNQYNELKGQYETKFATLTQNLLALQQKLQAECRKVQELTQQLNLQKQRILNEKNNYYQNLIKSKNEEIDSLRLLNKQSNSLKELQQLKITSNQSLTTPLQHQIKTGEENKATASQISILNEQILSLTNEILVRDQQIADLKNEIQRLEQAKTVGQNGIKNTESIIQKKQGTSGQWQKKEGDYKTQIVQLQKQLINLKRSLPQNQQPLSDKKTTDLGGNIQNLKSITDELHKICSSIKQLCEQRNGFGHQNQMYQAFIKKYDQIEEQFNNINIQTSGIQLKARFISKQLLKIKAHVVKSQKRATEQKKQILGMINPCLNAADELVKLSQTLSEPSSQLYL